MPGILKSVQAFDLSIGSGNTSTTGTLSKGQVLANCVPIFTASGPSGVDNMRSYLYDVYFSGSETVNVTRESSTGTLAITGYVLEFDPTVQNTSVQTGTFSMTGTSTSENISTVTLTKAFPIIYGESTTSGNADDDLVRCHFNTDSQLGFERDDSVGTKAGRWYVVESDAFTTQEEEAVSLSYAFNDTETISEVVMADTFLIATMENGTQANAAANTGCYTKLASSTTIYSEREGDGWTLLKDVFIIECNDSEFAVQRNDKDMDGEGTSANVDVTAIDQTRSTVHQPQLVCGKSAPGTLGTDIEETFAELSFVDSDTINITTGEAHTDTGICSWEVVEWEIHPRHATGQLGCNS